MASRRVMMLTNNQYVQPLKLSFNNKKVITPNAAYNSIVTKVSFEKPTNKDFKVKAWMRFNSDTFDGVQMVGSLFRGKSNKTITSCTFRIYSVDVDNTWAETLLVTATGSDVGDNKFSASTSESSLAPTALTGELTYKMEVEITRLGKIYTDIFYFNHIGIYDTTVRLRKRIDFLAITKLDE
jgi:hypothetical protein